MRMAFLMMGSFLRGKPSTRAISSGVESAQLLGQAVRRHRHLESSSTM